MDKQVLLESLIEKGETLHTRIDLKDKKIQGLHDAMDYDLCISIFFKKIDVEKYRVLVYKFSGPYPHPAYEAEKTRIFKTLDDAILYINNNYSKKFIDMEVFKKYDK